MHINLTEWNHSKQKQVKYSSNPISEKTTLCVYIDNETLYQVC